MLRNCFFHWIVHVKEAHLKHTDLTMWRKLKARIPFKKTMCSFFLISTVFVCVVVLLQHNGDNSSIVPNSVPVNVSTTISREEEYFPEYHESAEIETETENETTTPKDEYFPVRPGYAAKVKVNVNVSIFDPGTRPWNMSWSDEDPGKTTYMMSPYNWDNKKGSVTLKPYTPSPKPLVISWQASDTLLLKEKTSAMFKYCPVSHCTVSPSNKAVSKAIAIVYDDEKIAEQSPPDLKEGRMLIYYSMWTPNDIVTRKTKEELFDVDWKAAFNWVWSYRLDSDIFEPFAYIRKVNILPQPARLQRFVALIKAKTHLAVWINPRLNRFKQELSEGDRNVHRGKSHTRLEPYMKAFKKVAPLEAIGVSDLKAAMRPRNIWYHLHKYFFVLAFEWTDCAYYVSDLFFDVFDLRVLSVPVVRGSFNYTRHFPEGSFVNADDFESPEELAEYLTDLASRKKAYAEMLWRKLQYVRENALPSAWCQLCEMVHRAQDDKSLWKRIDNIYAWFQDGGGCQIVNKTVIDRMKAERRALQNKTLLQSGDTLEHTEVQGTAETKEQTIAVEEESFNQETENRSQEEVTVKEMMQEKEDAATKDYISTQTVYGEEDGTEQENVEYEIDEKAEEEPDL